ncbi:MAG: helix-turn-helix domain-containing protein [Nitrospirae bacterium]|nr:MAG: helix-turn-helix domain-containing protein [Nitrospirota bacterium]
MESNLLEYLEALHRLLDGEMRTLPASAQRVLLQLMRESKGRGRELAAIGYARLEARTGLNRMTIQRAIRLLRQQGWIEAVRLGTSGHTSVYRVRVLEALPERSTRPMRPLSRVDRLSPAHRSELEALYLGLPPAERAEYEDRVAAQIRELGLDPAKDLIKELVLYQLIMERCGPLKQQELLEALEQAKEEES